MLKLKIFPAGTASDVVSKFFEENDIMEFTMPSGQSEPFRISPTGDLIFQYLHKKEQMGVEFQTERLKDKLDSLQGRRIQAKLNYAHAWAQDQAHRGGKLKQIKAAENVARCETDLSNIEFDILHNRATLDDILKYGFDEHGDINIPAADLKAREEAAKPPFVAGPEHDAAIIYYGPHPCQVCDPKGKKKTNVVAAAAETPNAKELIFDYPAEADAAKTDGSMVYPNTHPELPWTQHKHRG